MSSKHDREKAKKKTYWDNQKTKIALGMAVLILPIIFGATIVKLRLGICGWGSVGSCYPKTWNEIHSELPGIFLISIVIAVVIFFGVRSSKDL